MQCCPGLPGQLRWAYFAFLSVGYRISRARLTLGNFFVGENDYRAISKAYERTPKRTEGRDAHAVRQYVDGIRKCVASTAPGAHDGEAHDGGQKAPRLRLAGLFRIGQ